MIATNSIVPRSGQCRATELDLTDSPLKRAVQSLPEIDLVTTPGRKSVVQVKTQ